MNMESDKMSELKKVKLSEIDDFNNHPFKVIKNNNFYELVDSIKENGLLTPLIVRKKEDGRYELISGHRRKQALEVLGILECNVEIRDLDNDEAIKQIIDIYNNYELYYVDKIILFGKNDLIKVFKRK